MDYADGFVSYIADSDLGAVFGKLTAKVAPCGRLTRELLTAKQPFTALFAYNDVSANGAIRAVRESGLGVPRDVSMVGFDDIREATYHLPSLTTVRQQLRNMGEISAPTLVERIEGRRNIPVRLR